MLAPESVPSPRPERCPRDVFLELTARHGPGCSERARACLLAPEPFRVSRSPLGDATEELCWYQKSSERSWATWMGVFQPGWMKLLKAGGMGHSRARKLTTRLSNVIAECRTAN